MKRALSLSQAATCENAKHPNCRCRCGGAFHGIARIIDMTDRAAFEALPEDDPHHLPDAKEKAKRRKARKELKKAKAALKAGQQYLPVVNTKPEDFFS